MSREKKQLAAAMAASGIGKKFTLMGSRANVKNAPWGPGVYVILKDVTIRWK